MEQKLLFLWNRNFCFALEKKAFAQMCNEGKLQKISSKFKWFIFLLFSVSILIQENGEMTLSFIASEVMNFPQGQ